MNQQDENELGASEYLKIKRRICGEQNDYSCSDCPLCTKYDGLTYLCADLEENYPERAEKIARIWAAEHAQKTYRDVLLEKFPLAELEDGEPTLCVAQLFFGGKCPHEAQKMSCSDCWKQPCED